MVRRRRNVALEAVAAAQRPRQHRSPFRAPSVQDCRCRLAAVSDELMQSGAEIRDTPCALYDQKSSVYRYIITNEKSCQPAVCRLQNPFSRNNPVNQLTGSERMTRQNGPQSCIQFVIFLTHFANNLPEDARFFLTSQAFGAGSGRSARCFDRSVRKNKDPCKNEGFCKDLVAGAQGLEP